MDYRPGVRLGNSFYALGSSDPEGKVGQTYNYANARQDFCFSCLLY